MVYVVWKTKEKIINNKKTKRAIITVALFFVQIVIHRQAVNLNKYRL